MYVCNHSKETTYGLVPMKSAFTSLQHTCGQIEIPVNGDNLQHITVNLLSCSPPKETTYDLASIQSVFSKFTSHMWLICNPGEWPQLTLTMVIKCIKHVTSTRNLATPQRKQLMVFYQCNLSLQAYIPCVAKLHPVNGENLPYPQWLNQAKVWLSICELATTPKKHICSGSYAIWLHKPTSHIWQKGISSQWGQLSPTSLVKLSKHITLDTYDATSPNNKQMIWYQYNLDLESNIIQVAKLQFQSIVTN